MVDKDVRNGRQTEENQEVASSIEYFDRVVGWIKSRPVGAIVVTIVLLLGGVAKLTNALDDVATFFGKYITAGVAADQVALVDVLVHNEDVPSRSGTPTIDIKVRNTSGNAAYIKRAIIETLGIWHTRVKPS